VPIEIVEVLRRSEQGATRPYICRASDGDLYFVKGIGASRRSQLCEWIAGRPAEKLGLPIAPFAVVEVPAELIAEGGAWLADLGVGPAFGSREMRVNELTVANLAEVPAELQQDVLVFDKWIRNGDRMLTQQGGNPNLFLEPREHALVVIDHNLAFDPAFDVKILHSYHVFREQAHSLAGDFLRRDEYNARLSDVLSHWAAIVAGIPPQWRFLDQEQTVPTDFDLQQVHAWLMQYQQDDFWTWQ
jgi:hypothetical protein